MANSNASVTLVLSYPNPGGGAALSRSFQLSCPFQGDSMGTIDVPDATAGSTAFSISFGSIAKATLVIVKNRTGQDMTLKINGSAALQNLPANEVVMFAAPALGASADLTAVSLTTTGSQSGAGYIDYFVFGDPTP